MAPPFYILGAFLFFFCLFLYSCVLIVMCFYAFRGGMYAKAKAPPDVYALAAAHSIDVALSKSESSSVTVLCHVAPIKGALNEPADINFIKCFVSVRQQLYHNIIVIVLLYHTPYTCL